jgi:hypothetical protein
MLEHYSQEVKVVLEALIHGDVGAISLRVLVVVGMECFLVSILDDCGNLHGRLVESKVHVALLVSELLNLEFVHGGSIVHDFVVDWDRCGGFWILVRNHEEVENAVSIVLHNCSVDHRTRLRIHPLPIVLLEDSRGGVKVKENVEDFDLTLGSHSARSEALDSLLNLVNLRLLDFFLHGWTANSISIDDDLVRAFSFVSFTILLEGFQNEVLENLCSPYRGFLLLDLFGNVLVLVHVLV